MVKFSKELEAQLIPEWKEAFVNYWHLKKHLKKIKILRRSNPSSSGVDAHSLLNISIFNPLRCITTKPDQLVEEEEEREESRDEDEDEVVRLVSEEDQVNRFMGRLDEELDKVNDFYEMKEEEFVERGYSLNKQLQIMVDLKRILSERRRWRDSTTTHRSSSTLSSATNPGVDMSDASVTAEIRSEARAAEVIEALESNGVSFIGARGLWGSKKPKPKTPMRVVGAGGMSNSMKTISAAMAMLWEDLVNTPRPRDANTRRKIQYAEKMIRTAYVEFYRGLTLLKTYSSLNMLAFTKILKKFDKVANREESNSYLRMVKGKHFISSDKVLKQMEEVESLFIEHFAESDRKKAMKYLRPRHHHRDSHMLSFLVGVFTGCFVTLFVVYAILAHLSGMFSDSRGTYMETIYPIFSMFALLSLHLFVYGCNLSMWNATRINYNFIFDFQPKKALKHRDAFLICTTTMTALITAMVLHLFLKSSGFHPTQVDAVPACLLLISIALLVCPLNIFYRSTRYCFLGVTRNIVCSPFCKVLMADFFMADQLTSQIPLLRHLETTTCYFLAGTFRTHQFDTCKNNKLYRQLAYVISFSPYYWRAMQCVRRWLDESDTTHLANLGKYVSAMVAAGARLTYAQQPESVLWMIIVLVTSAAATVYQLYWDFVKDWGLLNPGSKNAFLRDNLVLKNKCVYYISIAMNVVLRVAWVESVLRLRIGVLESRMLDFFLASLEVIRRGHWNFYRLENEHLNNVGKFRAEKAVPLPFHEAESDD